jgi:hypothetical protein
LRLIKMAIDGKQQGVDAILLNSAQNMNKTKVS